MLDLNNINFGSNLRWFIGVVENRMDPNFLGRVQVRCVGDHTNDNVDLPTEDLPWAMVMQPTTSGAQTDVGRSPTGLVEGSWVVGFYLDGADAQQPLVIGALGGYATKPDKLNRSDDPDWFMYGFKDVRTDSLLEQRGYPSPPITVRKNEEDELGVEIVEDQNVQRYPRLEGQDQSTTPKLARGILDLGIFNDPAISSASTFETNTRVLKEPMMSRYLNETKNVSTARKSFKFDQPSSPYAAIYPFNHVWETESGHILEFDDTPRAERIHEYHRSGTFREIHPDGKLVTQTVSERYDFNEANKFEYVKGSKYSTFKRGYALMINSSRVSGEDYELRVCGSSNYNLTLEQGDFNILASSGRVNIISSSVNQMGMNEIIQSTALMQTNAVNHQHTIQNEYELNARGMLNLSGGNIKVASSAHYSLGVADNIVMNAGHTVSMIAENNFFMLPIYAPRPLGVEVKARHGHIELNAQDGDTRISSRPKGFIADLASLTVTSPLPTSIATLQQFQPSPEFEDHYTHPASIIGQTQTGYIYFLSRLGNIVLETQTVNSIKIKATQLGTVEETGGFIRMVSTATDIHALARMNVLINAGLSLNTNSKIGTFIQAGTEVFVKAGTRFNAMAETGATIHTNTGVVQVGDFAAVEPALKGLTFMTLLLSHQHLTPMGPTGPLDVVTNPYVSNFIFDSYCKKTFVF